MSSIDKDYDYDPFFEEGEWFVPLFPKDPEFRQPKMKREELTLERYLMDWIKRGLVDEEPPYQRNNDAWTKAYRESYVRSLFNGFACSSYHLCPAGPGNERKRLLMDGLQRTTAIKKFMDNEFTVSIQSRKTGKKKKVSWKDIESKNEYASLKHKFLGSPIHIHLYSFLDLDGQQKVFEIINHSSSLNVNETMYSQFFRTRILMVRIFEQVFKDSMNIISQRRRKSERRSEVRFTHEIMVLARGNNMTDHADHRSLRQKSLKDSAKAIELRLVEFGVDPTEGDVDPIDVLKLVDTVDVLRQFANAYYAMSEFDPSILTPFGRDRTVADVMGFWMYLYDTFQYHPDCITQNQGTWCEILKEYEHAKRTMRWDKATADPATMEAKYNWLKEKFEEKKLRHV